MDDHASAIDTVFHQGKNGETYNIGGNNERKNIEIVHSLCDIVDSLTGVSVGTSRSLITFVTDRPGHDRRYAIDASKIKNELNWQPSITFNEGFLLTAKWYLANERWLENVTSGKYQQFYAQLYTNR